MFILSLQLFSVFEYILYVVVLWDPLETRWYISRGLFWHNTFNNVDPLISLKILCALAWALNKAWRHSHKIWQSWIPDLFYGRKENFIFSCLPGADGISFDGHGVISYRFRSKKMKIVKDVISLKFRTTAGDGVLLHGEGQQGDYISLELCRARLKLSINLGSLALSLCG